MGKKFSFRLASLLRMKQQLLEQQEGRLKKINSEVQQAKRRVADIGESLSRENECLKLRQGDTASVMNSATVFEARMQDAKRQEEETKKRWREVNTTYVAMSRELSNIQKMRNAQWETHQQENATANQIELDELILRKWKK